MAKEKACKNCKSIYEKDVCLNCGRKETSDTFKGKVEIINSEKSEIGKQLKIHYIIRLLLENLKDEDFSAFFEIIKQKNIEKIISFYGDMDFPGKMVIKLVTRASILKFLLKFIIKNPKLLMEVLKVLL